MTPVESRRILQHPDWHDASILPPPAVREWLLHEGSLTRKLQQHCARLDVAIAHEGWMSDDHWLREVWLSGDGIPWIYAQTRIPRATLSHTAAPLQNSGNRPIGLWLYAQQPTRLSLRWRYDSASDSYARQTALALNGYPLDIREHFLPGFPYPED